MIVHQRTHDNLYCRKNHTVNAMRGVIRGESKLRIPDLDFNASFM